MASIAEFKRFWVHQLRIRDCDPGIYALQYLCARMELNLEQRYWLCWIYANTYQVATAWVIWNEFPDYAGVSVDRLRAWNNDNYSRLPYQKDQKWLRNHLAPMYESYRKIVGPRQSDFFDMYRGDYPAVWKIAMSFHKFGRYTSWMYLQALKDVCGLNVEPTSLELHHDSSKQHRTGLAIAMNKVDPEASIEEMNEVASRILREVHQKHHRFLPKYGAQVDYFSMETALCAYSKLHRGQPRGRYLGYYLSRWGEDIHKTAGKNDWPGIDWELLWQCRKEGLHPDFCWNSGVCKTHMDLYPLTGRFSYNTVTEKELDDQYELELRS